MEAANDCKVIHVDFANKRVLRKEVRSHRPAGLAKDKLSYFAQLIDEGMTSIVVDGRAPNTRLPAHLRGQPSVVLNWSHRFELPDFEYDEKGVRGTLSFKGEAFTTNVPWRSVHAIFSTRNPNMGMMWEPERISLLTKPVIETPVGRSLRQRILKGIKGILSTRSSS